VFSVLVCFLLNYFLIIPIWVFCFVLFGAVFVDIDSCSSRVGRKFWLFSWVLRHRGFLHSLFFSFVFSLVIGIFNLWAGFGFFVGYVSHLFLDCFTFQGVRLFWPFGFSVKGFIRSGSWIEDVIFVLLLLGVFCFFVVLIF
jgi:inner membrane protein